MFGTNGSMAVGMGRALKRSGRAGRAVGVACDGNPDLHGFNGAGALAAIRVQGLDQRGETGVATIAWLLRKGAVEKVMGTGAGRVIKDTNGAPDTRSVLS